MVTINLTTTLHKILLIAISIFLIYFGKSFLVPISFSVLLALLLIPTATKLESFKLKRGMAAFLSILMIVICFAIIISLLAWQMADFQDQLPQMKQQLMKFMQSIRDYISTTFNIPKDSQEKMMKEGGNGGGQMVTKVISGISGFLVDTILVLVYTFLIIYLRSHFKAFLLKLVSPGERKEVNKIIDESKLVVFSYLSGMGLMISILWVLYGIGFTIVGIKGALFFAVLCGVLEIIPFVGNITGTAITALMALAQGGDVKKVLFVLLVYAIVQFLQTYVLEPLVVGSKVKINPFFTIAALVFAEFIWGVAGMVLAIPFLGILKIIFDHTSHLKPYGFLLSESEDVERKETKK